MAAMAVSDIPGDNRNSFAATALELGNARLAGDAFHELARGFVALADELDADVVAAEPQ